MWSRLKVSSTYCTKYESGWNVKNFQTSAEGLAKNEDPKTSKWHQPIMSAVTNFKAQYCCESNSTMKTYQNFQQVVQLFLEWV